jgi:hypothetical protein
MANPKINKKKPAVATRNDGAITVRMFCQGLGDCFLISIPQEGGRPYSILIDCGVAMGTPNSDKNMPAVVRKIGELTHGVVDLLVVTHEHWDHVSGFLQASGEMTPDKLKFQHLWWAWTENPSDQLAQELREKYSKAKLAIARARELGAQFSEDPSSQAHLAALDSVLAFYGMAGPGVAKGGGDIHEAMGIPAKLVTATAGEGAIECLLPGRQLQLPGKGLSGMAAGVRAYILGPPHVAEKVRNINPSNKDPQTYEKASLSEAAAIDALGVNWAWMAAAMDADLGVAGLEGNVGDAANMDRSKPFDLKEQIDIKGAEAHAYFDDHYFANTPENEGRRIDGDWLWTGAQKLALHLESYTNNISLVIALELPQSKNILLFAGDAQVGNWLSWHDQDYLADDGRKVTATNLLNRTVLYKVGHHGSHNATLRQKGLDLMTHPDLVAMLPVEADAVARLGYGEMPLQSLVKVLKERAQDRVLRLDDAWVANTAPGTWGGKLNQAKLSAETLDVIVKNKPAKRPLFMEYVIRDDT